LKENNQYMAPMTDIGSHIHGHLRKSQQVFHSACYHLLTSFSAL
jgi:hypothetical protein